MKRLCIIATILCTVSTGTLFAASMNQYLALGAGYINLDQVGQSMTTASVTRNLQVSGYGLQVVGMTGSPFGFLGVIGAAMATSETTNGVSGSLSAYPTRLLFDSLIGVGYQMRLTKSLSLLVGVGGDGSGGIITQTGGYGYVDMAYAAGVGALADFVYSLTPAIGVYAGGHGSYDPFALVQGIDYTFEHGYTYSASAGLKISY